MIEPDLYDLVVQAKSGDRGAMEEIVELFQPIIQKSCWRAKPQERLDLQQQMVEKIIRAVFAYDLESIPDFTQFTANISESE
ncbi:helix-turn-helix domain-containing protein [Paenibacillus periandrae]|uniref:helix-turn-helix domain-containing protein n=1 Tax=Paenibacillus periandrae TaxID=1761741 RepID=UPI001F092021|nr:helix-turn-helix domain-containing protein [Paenibacillus periandrae]